MYICTSTYIYMIREVLIIREQDSIHINTFDTNKSEHIISLSDYKLSKFTIMTASALILNNRLPWDGSHLGAHPETIITHQWSLEGIIYYGVSLANGWSTEHPSGTIFCTATCTKDVFPCIVEDIKPIFGLPRRGVHRITINNKEYVLYYVPISVKGEVVWETPLNRLDSKHALRKDPNFRKAVQKAIAFCDILALCNTGEPSIRIRPGVETQFVPISVNENNTTIISGGNSANYDYSILSKTLFTKWFGEETSISDIVKEMVDYQTHKALDDNPEKKLALKVPTVETKKNGMMEGPQRTNLAIISSEIRSRVDEVIKRYDINYIWYSCFIIDRMSRHLLIENT